MSSRTHVQGKRAFNAISYELVSKWKQREGGDGNFVRWGPGRGGQRGISITRTD